MLEEGREEGREDSSFLRREAVKKWRDVEGCEGESQDLFGSHDDGQLDRVTKNLGSLTWGIDKADDGVAEKSHRT